MPVHPHHDRRWKTLAVLGLSLVLIGLDNTVLNVALPSMQRELDASASVLQWMVDAYLLVFAGLLLVAGTLGDRHGRKRALQAGLVVFGLAGADLIAAPTNWPDAPRPAGERPMEVVRVQAGACANRVFVAAADRCGSERGVDWVGGSVIVDPDGWPLAGPARPGQATVLVADCALTDARTKAIGPRNDVHADRRSEIYGR